jgi:Uma2 family endonuclease
MTPSGIHETDKKRLARLLEAWADETGVQLEGAGSWTIKSKRKQRGAEPDECYFVGLIPDDAQRPDIAIEVVRTSGGIDKLEVWRGLGVAEVWLWQDRRLRFFSLHDDGYREQARSQALPDLDPALLLEAMAAPSQTDAVRLLRERMRG